MELSVHGHPGVPVQQTATMLEVGAAATPTPCLEDLDVLVIRRSQLLCIHALGMTVVQVCINYKISGLFLPFFHRYI